MVVDYSMTFRPMTAQVPKIVSAVVKVACALNHNIDYFLTETYDESTPLSMVVNTRFRKQSGVGQLMV
jgi:uncharacterized HAD superfamily protein